MIKGLTLIMKILRKKKIKVTEIQVKNIAVSKLKFLSIALIK